MKTLLYLREFAKQERISYYLKQFSVSEKLSENELIKFQSEKLLKLLLYIKQYNPYYSHYLCDNGISLDEPIGHDPYFMLKKLPIIDKLYIKKHAQEWLTLNKNSKLTKAHTTGSTGTPFEFYHSSISRDIKTAGKCRLLAWHGVNRWEKQVYFGNMLNLDEPRIATIKRYLNDRFVWNKKIIDTTTLNKSSIESNIEMLNRLKPVTVWGYPSIIGEIARHSLKYNKPIKNINLKMVILSGESYTTIMKDLVRQAFNIEPDDEYNSSEGFIAGTCEHHNLHLYEDVLIPELLNDDGVVSEYGKGELLITHLYSFDFPFIRYNMGDVVEISKERCSCGKKFKLISAVDGRTSSVIYNGDEKIVNEACNTYISRFLGLNGYEKYQIIQYDMSNLIVKLVPSDTFNDYSGFESKIRNLFDKLEVRFEYLDDIPRDSSGKYKALISQIDKAKM